MFTEQCTQLPIPDTHHLYTTPMSSTSFYYPQIFRMSASTLMTICTQEIRTQYTHILTFSDGDTFTHLITCCSHRGVHTGTCPSSCAHYLRKYKFKKPRPAGEPGPVAPTCHRPEGSAVCTGPCWGPGGAESVWAPEGAQLIYHRLHHNRLVMDETNIAKALWDAVVWRAW